MESRLFVTLQTGFFIPMTNQLYISQGLELTEQTSTLPIRPESVHTVMEPNLMP